jgi:hypothetical protein
MKKLLFIALCFIASNSKAQKIDTVKYAIQIQPIVTNAMSKDTAYQLTWRCNGLDRDTTASVGFYVAMFNREARKVLDFNVIVPPSVIKLWGLSDIVIDDYILSQYNLTKKN